MKTYPVFPFTREVQRGTAETCETPLRSVRPNCTLCTPRVSLSLAPADASAHSLRSPAGKGGGGGGGCRLTHADRIPQLPEEPGPAPRGETGKGETR